MTFFQSILMSKYKKILKKIEDLNKRNVQGYKTFTEYCIADEIMIKYFNELKLLEKHLPSLTVDSYERFNEKVFEQLKEIYNKRLNEITNFKDFDINSIELLNIKLKKLAYLRKELLLGYGHKCDKMLDFFVNDIDEKIKNMKLEESDLFILEEKERKDKTKQYLKPESTMIVEQEKYEFPTIELLYEENEIKEIIQSKQYLGNKSNIMVGLKEEENIRIIDLHETSHILIAGTTGIGKTTLLDNIIINILYKSSPYETKIIIFDTNNNGLRLYNGIPHLLLPVITDSRKSVGALAWLVQEIENRYGLFTENNIENINEYNNKQQLENKNILPEIVVIIDEILDIMNAEKEDVENSLIKITKLGKKVGIILIISTNRPSTDVISSSIKANIFTRISFYLPARMDSKMILDMDGAEKLKNHGDLLFKTIGITKPQKYHCPFISGDAIKSVVNFLKKNGLSFSADILDAVENHNIINNSLTANQSEEEDPDPFLEEAIDIVVETGEASTSFIQRRFKVGYARAGRIIDQMEERGVISGYHGSKPRDVLWTLEKLAEMKMNKH